jgi:hypothetical protein
MTEERSADEAAAHLTGPASLPRHCGSLALQVSYVVRPFGIASSHPFRNVDLISHQTSPWSYSGRKRHPRLVKPIGRAIKAI